MNAKKMLFNVATTLGKHCPTILTGVAIVATVTAVVLASKATPKAKEILKEKKEAGAGKLETAKALAPVVGPTMMAVAVSVGCALTANHISARRINSLATAYSISRISSEEYKKMTKEVVGEEKAKEISTKVAEEQVKNTPVDNVIITDGGNTLCLDSYSGRYFRSSSGAIEKIINKANYDMTSGQMVYSLDELYCDLGLSGADCSHGVGWSCDTGLIEVSFDSTLGPNNEPCLVMQFDRMPSYRYDRFDY